MIFALLTGLVLGYIIAIPPGPVGVTAMKLSLNHGKKPGTYLSLGNGVVDFFFCIIAIFTAKGILNLLDDFSSDYPLIMLIIQLSIVTGIFALGIINIKYKTVSIDDESPTRTRMGRIFNDLTHRGPFLLGIAVALTNIPNPTYFPSLIGTTAFGLGTGFFEHGVINNFSFAFGFGVGNFLWLYTIVSVITRFKHKFSDNTVQRIHKFAGFTLIGFSTLLGINILRITEWHVIFRLLTIF
jgi:threonine/homoserine/homoserine lactone efflux protein